MNVRLKFSNAHGKAIHGRGSLALPRGKRPGAWMPVVRNLEPCVSGYHVIESWVEALEWIGQELYEVETRGRRVPKSEHVGVYEQIRVVRRLDGWNERTARLFACDCAERVAHLDKTGTATRTIGVARRYAYGKATAHELDAARDAALGAAARNATAAARDAALGAAARNATAAAWAAAKAAAWAAAKAAAGAAAKDTAWAAWAAARDAAWDAAWDAARNAAWNTAARDVPKDAAWDAERARQARRLRWYAMGGGA